MSTPPNFTNFTFWCGQGMPSDWTEAHARSLYNSIVADPIQHTRNVWTHAHIHWMMKSIWFCDKIAQLFPSFQRDLSNLVGKYWLATSDPMSSDADTGLSDMGGDDDEDAGYGAAQPPTTPMDVDPPAPEGEPNGNETGEEWWIASEMQADSVAATLCLLLSLSLGTVTPHHGPLLHSLGHCHASIAAHQRSEKWSDQSIRTVHLDDGMLS
ncbi:hypothetical protein ARMGADRAFT_1039527 [Armillaria gallica]|uniref:Uncharacterized protein n=1 Tax=Armillaria gallica TaxID=47427 RepID=A0A2H3CRT7_ARMGA|nr:hypothetical protein ARMGADRAFT_1039527 [Armillaria gallica]